MHACFSVCVQRRGTDSGDGSLPAQGDIRSLNTTVLPQAHPGLPFKGDFKKVTEQLLLHISSSYIMSSAPPGPGSGSKLQHEAAKSQLCQQPRLGVPGCIQGSLLKLC